MLSSQESARPSARKMPLLAASAAVARAPVPQVARAAPRGGLLSVRPSIVSASPRARRAFAAPRVVRVVALTRRDVDKTSHITAALLPLAAAVALIIDPLASCVLVALPQRNCL